MVHIAPFTPTIGSSASKNVLRFVASCRGLLGNYQTDCVWEDNRWLLPGLTEEMGRKAHAVVFSRYENRGGHPFAPMTQPFLDFAKAFFLYQQAVRPTLVHNYELSALRIIEAALIQCTGGSRIELLTPAICNIACELLATHASTGSCYRTGSSLAYLVKFVSEAGLTNAPLQWKPHFKPVLSGIRVGFEADIARERKLPSEAALEALPQCFRLAKHPLDIVVSSVAALLCSAPDRISEVFRLPSDCEVERLYDGKKNYGLRWVTSKSDEETIKWIPPTMKDVVQAAIWKLKRITEPARKIAEWYEAHPGELYLPPEAEHFRGKRTLVLYEVNEILGSTERTTAAQWVRTHAVPTFPTGKSDRRKEVLFSDFEKAVLKCLPVGFPVLDPRTGLTYSKALLVTRLNELNHRRIPNPLMIQQVGASHISVGLGSGVGRGRNSIFTRFGFREPDGQSIKVTTHQFRYWLNTLAHRGGMSQLDIAKWSGRTNIKDNQVYDLMTSDELMNMTRDATKDDAYLFGPIVELKSMAPVTNDEFMRLEFPTAHVTELGFCVHDYTMLPCLRHRDCLNCSEFVCVKGDQVRNQRIKERLAQSSKVTLEAKKANEDGYYGAERWLEHHLATEERLRGLVSVLDDPILPVGSVIRIAPKQEFSPSCLAVEDKRTISNSVVPATARRAHIHRKKVGNDKAPHEGQSSSRL